MIQKNLCNFLNISKDKLSIKAKTNEKLDSIGKGKSYFSILHYFN